MTEEVIKANSFLREKYLRFLSFVASNKSCEVYLHEDTKVSGEFKGVDMDFEHILLTNLKTPGQNVPSAQIRTSDVVSITFKK